MSDLSREREIFELALEQRGDARKALLARLCGDDKELLDRVRRLLSAHEHAQQVPTSLPKPEEALDEAPREIGPYRILERVGEGGMGVVFLAQQMNPIRRRVALKIIKLGMDTKEVVARFDSERQALALMNHANIARILDAGATARGRPFFVMEYVPGISIVEYCDSKRLGTIERLRLFAQVSHAVQHAHQKGVIHRDLKPGNLLVTEDDGLAVPKVIDFGVAKATHQQLSQITVHTGIGHMIGTPAYMSPEQAEMTALDVDTRSDVYSLGVVLYELLTGTVPFELSDKSPLEVQRIICEQVPEPPSTRLKKLGDKAASVARNRGTTPSALQRALRGELDQLVLTALSKDRRHRYQTALALANDVERFLNNEPVQASSPSATYRAAKFVRRHRLAVGASSIAVALIMALTAFYTFRLADERDRVRHEADRANQAARTANQVTEFLLGLFAVSDPSESRGNTVTAREILDEGADRITNELQGQPEIQATLMDAIGRVYLSLALYSKATPLLESALEIRRNVLGEEHPDVAHSLNYLGEATYANGDYQGAEALLRQALELRRKVLGEEHPDVGESLNNVGAVLRAKGDYAAAETFYREALALRRKTLGNEHLDVTQSLNNLAVLLHEKGDYETAETLYRETLELRTRLMGGDHPDTINSMNNLGVLLISKGDPAGAELLLRPALEMRRRVLGENHPEYVESLMQLARALRIQGEYEEAERLLREALTVRLNLYGKEDARVAISLVWVARVLEDKGECNAALPLFLEAIDTYQRTLGSNHFRVAQSRGEYGKCLMELGRFREAEEQLLTSYEGLKARFGAQHNLTQTSLGDLINLYETWGMPEKAATHRDLLKSAEDADPPREAPNGSNF